MGWSDQGWAQVEEPEWEVADPSEPPAGRTSRTAQLSILVLIVVVSRSRRLCRRRAAPSASPARTGVRLQAPASRRQRRRWLVVCCRVDRARPASFSSAGRRSPTDPSTYTLHGRTAATDGVHSTGKVVLRGRWDDGPWLVLARTRTDAAGNFEVTSKLRRRGLLELRLMLPDGFIGTKTVRVE